MKRKLGMFLISLGVCGPAVQLPAASDYLAESVKRIQPAIVTILTYDSQGRLLSQAVGFFVNEQGHFVTCLSVFEGAYRAAIRTSEGAEYPVARVLADNIEGGLVKLSADIPGQKAVMPLRMAAVSPEITDPVIVVSAAAKPRQAFSEGIVVVIRNTPLIGPVYQISAPVEPNLAGSPVLNGRAEAIGVAVTRKLEEQNVNFAIDMERLLSVEPSQGRGKAIREWVADISANPLGPPNHAYHEAIAFVYAGKYQKALDLLKKASEAGTQAPQPWLYIGFCHAELGRYLEAVQAYEQAIKLKSDYAEAYYYMALAQGQLGRPMEAVETCKKAVSIKPTMPEGHWLLGLSYAKLNRYSEAIDALKKAVEVRPGYAEAYHDLGMVYGQLGRHQEALEAF